MEVVVPELKQVAQKTQLKCGRFFMAAKNIAFFVLIMFLMLVALSETAQAQSEWLPPQPIPFYDSDLPPLLVADQNRTVHAFNVPTSTSFGEPAINYRQWTLVGGWTQPVDILLSPRAGGMASLTAFLDQNGIFHLVFFAGQSGVEGSIYYTSVPASAVHEPRSWSDPVLLDDMAGPLASVDLSYDSTGSLSVAYVGRENGVGVYEVESEDLGKTWSRPAIVSLIYKDEQVPARVRVYFDSLGNLHALWTQLDASGQGEVVVYAPKDPVTGRWNNAIILAKKEGNDFATDYGTIIEHEGELIVFYYDGPPSPAQHMRRSKDWGKTWSEPIRPFPQEGGNGGAVLLHDSQGVLHIVLANRIDELAIGGMWHGTWLGDGWSDLEMVNAQSSYEEMLHASRPRAVISQGNALLTAWWHDVRDSPLASYSYSILDSPELPIVTPGIPAGIIDQTNEEQAIAVVLTLTAEPILNRTGDIKDLSAQTKGSGLATTMLLGSIPVVVLIILFILIARRRIFFRA